MNRKWTNFKMLFNIMAIYSLSIVGIFAQNSISITSPAPGQTLVANNTYTFTVSASGPVSKVVYWVDNWNWIGEIGNAPFSITWLNNLSNGSHVLRARAVYSDNSTVDATNITFNVGTADTQPPSSPSNLSGSNISQNGISLNWNASTDNVGVTGYNIYSNGSFVASTASTSYNVTGLTCNTSYSFTVNAFDATGNQSSNSSPSSISTSGCSGFNIIAPISGQTLSPNTTFLFQVSTIGSVSKVVYWVDNWSWIGEADNAPYSLSWTNNLSAGSHVVKARLVFTDNTTLQANDVTFNVGSQGGGNDTQAPTVPQNLGSSAVTSSSFTLTWSASSDNVGVTSYEVFENGNSLGTTGSTSLNINSLSTSNTYSMTVRAGDAAGNWSAQSSALSVTTSATISSPGNMSPGTNFWNIGWEGWQDFFASGVDWKSTNNPWNPTFINELQQAKIKCLRFMDWNLTNTNSVIDWNQRIPKTANHYNIENTQPCFVDNYDYANNIHHLVPNGTTGYGVSIDWQIDLCNRIGADIWMNIPATASDDFVYQLANLLNNQLNSNQKIYIEWANEIWNWGTPVTVYARNQSDALGLTSLNINAYIDPWRRYDIYASVRAFAQFERVFGQNSPRLVKVVAGQVGYHWSGTNVNNMVLGDLAALNNSTINPNGETFNAYAVAPYMGGQSIAAEQTDIANEVQGVIWAKNSLTNTGISLVCYEGGADNSPDNNLALTRDPAQEQTYVTYLSALAPYINGVFNQYCFYGGNWGLKYSAGESPSVNPKWRGWIDYWNGQSGRLSSEVDIETQRNLQRGTLLYPNPAKEFVNLNIQSKTSSSAMVSITNVLGEIVLTKNIDLVAGTNTVTINTSQFSTGLYSVQVKGSENIYSSKLVIE